MLYRDYTKGASHSQWAKVPCVSSPPSTFQYTFLKILAVRNKAIFCSKPVLMVIPTTTGTTSTRLISHNFSNLPLQILVFLNLFTLLFLNSVTPWWSNIQNNCLVALFLINNNIRSSGLNNMVTLDGHVPQYLPSFIFLYLILLVFIPLLISVQAILTAELPIGQPGNVVMSSALVLFSRQTLTLTNYMIYCFTTYKAGSPRSAPCWTQHSLFSVPVLGL